MRAWWSRAFMFQSTPPHGRRPGAGGNPTGGTGFNPRLRTGGDLGQVREAGSWQVSIHASAREATSVILEPSTEERVSIHASAREATRCVFTQEGCANVSIHASAREATCQQQQKHADDAVSIHASAREATRAWRRRAPLGYGFNPRLRTGGDF